MKKFAQLAVLSLVILSLSALPAFAAVHVTAHAKTHVAAGRTAKIVFTAKTSRRSTVKVTLFRNHKAVRTVAAKRSGKTYTASWNVRGAAGAVVKPGIYTYRVRARTKSGSGYTSGSVVVTVTPPPVTTTTPTPAPTTTSTTTAPAPTTTTTPVVPVPPVVVAPPASRWLGFYVPGAPESLTPLQSLQSQIGTTAAVVNFFISDSESFPTARVNNCKANGSIPLITLEFWTTQNTGSVDEIINGSRDSYLRTFAASAKASGTTIWLRPLHEMNGNWYPWAGVVGTNTPAKVVAAWKHIHDVLIGAGATNIKFVWNMNGLSCPNTTANAMENYWPGDAYVDYTSIDGYNWGAHSTWSTWATPESIFGDAYRRINALSSKPMFLAEIACTSNGGDKAVWMTNFFTSMNAKFPKIKGVCWFNADKEEDWRVEETPATLAAIQKVAATGF